MNIDLFTNSDTFLAFFDSFVSDRDIIEIDGKIYGATISELGPRYDKNPRVGADGSTTTTVTRRRLVYNFQLSRIVDSDENSILTFTAHFASPWLNYSTVRQSMVDMTKFQDTKIWIDEKYPIDEIEHVLTMLLLTRSIP